MADPLRPPRAIVFDLDDTLLTAYRNPGPTWAAIIAEHAEALGEHCRDWVTSEVLVQVADFLSDDAGRKLWRLEGDATRRRVIRAAFHRLNLRRPPRSAPLHGVDADRIADRFESFLEETITLKPGAHELLGALATQGVLLGLLTNGSGPRQRGKIARFDLERYFNAIRIEEEAGIGKPDPRAYRAILRALGVKADESWMIGDDPVWDIRAPKRAGMGTVLYSEDAAFPTPPEADARIDRLSALMPLLDAALPTPATS